MLGEHIGGWSENPGWNTGEGELFLYHGSLDTNEPQYKDPRFIGLPLRVGRHNREIRVISPLQFPVPDQIADAFQSQDVMEHIPADSVVPMLNEIYRVLKPGGLFRLSVPDYRSRLLRRRSVFDEGGEIVGDAGMGCHLTFDQALQIIVPIPPKLPGYSHQWFPTVERLRDLINQSDFRTAKEIKWLHGTPHKGDPFILDIPSLDVFL